MVARKPFTEQLIAWQKRAGRHDLPWQNTRDPYRIWLSEIMLQQTQVATVIPYYLRFLDSFPSVTALAAAPIEAVIEHWAGLGYYARARNLHKCAQQIAAHHGGQFPANAEQLAELPGIGRSTAAAVAAFAFGQRAAILDGNVKRVLCRQFGVEGFPGQAAIHRQLWELAESLLPAGDIEPYTQGLMDLGAGVCLARRPACERCPLAEPCVARAEGAPQRYPVKTRRTKRGRRRHALLWLEQGDALWLVQRPATGVWAGLTTLPEFESADALAAFTAGWPGQGAWLAPIEHALTHFDWTLEPLRWRWPARVPKQLVASLPEGRWVERRDALALGLPAPIRRLLEAG